MPKIAHWNFADESLLDRVGSVPFVHTRAVASSRRNASGVLEVVASGDPIYEYNYDGTFRGLALFSSSSNLLSHDPEDLAAEAQAVNVTWTANSQDDPYGNTNTADVMADADDALTKNCYIRDGSVTYSTSNDDHEHSIFIKVITEGSLTNQYCYLEADVLTGVDAKVVYDMDTMTVVSEGSSVKDSGVEQYANGWYRLWNVWRNASDTGGTANFGFTDSTGSLLYAHDGRSVAVWGHLMREMHLTTDPHSGPMPYSAVTNVPNSTMTCTDLTWLNPIGSALSVFQEYYWVSDYLPSSARYTLHLDFLADAGDRLQVAVANPSGIVELYHGTGTDGNLSFLNDLSQGLNRYALSMESNDLRGSWNASAVQTEALVTFPWSNSCTSMTMDYWFGGGRPVNGWHRELIFWDEATTDADLVDLSTNGFASAFGGTIAGDGGVVWPARANDPRWTQLISDSGITSTGNFTDDVKAALIALSGASGGSLDDLWKKTLAANNVTDISEPYLY